MERPVIDVWPAYERTQNALSWSFDENPNLALQ